MLHLQVRSSRGFGIGRQREVAFPQLVEPPFDRVANTPTGSVAGNRDECVPRVVTAALGDYMPVQKERSASRVGMARLLDREPKDDRALQDLIDLGLGRGKFAEDRAQLPECLLFCEAEVALTGLSAWQRPGKRGDRSGQRARCRDDVVAAGDEVVIAHGLQPLCRDFAEGSAEVEAPLGLDEQPVLKKTDDHVVDRIVSLERDPLNEGSATADG